LVEIDGFKELVVNWWHEVHLGIDMVLWWQFKLGHLRSKMKG
jgi:hypothetical protein